MLHLKRKQLRSVAFIALLSLVVLTPLAFYLARTPGEAAAWFDDTYSYRHKVTFTHNASVTDNRAVTFTFDTAELITAGTMQSDCDDTRFTTISGQPLLFDLTGTCNNAATTYEVILPETFNGTNLFYVYYGNASAPNVEVDSTGYTALTPSGGDPSLTNPTSSGNQEKTTGPLIYWSFDEGYGATIYDSSGNNRHGTVAGWPREHASDCVSGSCIKGSPLGVDPSYVTKAYSASSDARLLFGTNDFTVSTWAKRVLAAPTSSEIFTSWSGSIVNGAYGLYMNTSGNYCFGTDDDFSFTPDDAACSTTNYADGTWHHVTGVRRGNAIYVYVDGKLAGQDNSLAGTGSLSGTNNTLTVGGMCTNTCNASRFTGLMDEFKLYDYARTTTQISTDYHARLIPEFSTSLGQSSTANVTGNLTEKLIGYWFAEQDSSINQDRSGAINYLNTVNSLSSTVHGRYGSGANFIRSSSRYAYVADTSTLSITGNLTLTAWINPSSNTAATQYNIMGKWDGANESYLLAQYGDEVRLYIDDAANYVETTAANLATSTWYHVVGVYDASAQSAKIYINGQEAAVATNGTIPSSIADDAGRFHIGAEDSTTSAANFFDGVMDEARLYTRVLSSTEVSQLYTIPQPPIYYFPFDEGSGTTANSRGMLAFNTTLTNQPKWTKGKLGSAINFNGVASVVTGSATSHTAVTQNFTLSAWVYRQTPGRNDYLVTHSNGTTANVYTFKIDTSDQLFLSWYNGSSTITITSSVAVSQPAGSWVHYAVTKDEDTNEVKFYQNGTQLGTTQTFAGANNISGGSAWFFIGCVAVTNSCSNPNSFSGSLDELKIYPYPLTSKQIVQDMNAGHPSVGSPVASALGHWRFDEGANDTCTGGTNDVCNAGNGGSTLDGAQSNMAVPATSTSGWNNSGKFNKALSFDGTNDYISVDDVAQLDITSQISVSTWVYFNTAPSAYTKIVGKWNETGDQRSYALGWHQADSRIRFMIDATGTNTGNDNTSVSAKNAVQTGQWYHYVGTYDGTHAKIYVNGQLEGISPTFTNGIFSSTADLIMGGSGGELFGGLNNYIDGQIDEVKVYTYALTADEVKLDYNRGSAIALGVEDTGQNLSGGAGSAPVAYWSFNEKTGQSLIDSSGNAVTGGLGANGSIESDDPTWAIGKIGTSLTFDGSNDLVNLGNVLGFTSSFTISTWVYLEDPLNNCTDIIINKNGGPGARDWSLYNECGGVTFIVSADGTVFSVRGSASAISPRTWTHIEAVYNASLQTMDIYINGILDNGTLSGSAVPASINATSNQVRIGSRSSDSTYLEGRIDEMKIYNYARTAAQIAFDYNGGAPLAHWTFDECQGSTAYDSAPNSNGGFNGFNGTITPGDTTGDNDTVGTCNSGTTTEMWHDGTTGKLNGSLGFDGTNDYVVVSDTPSLRLSTNLSVSAWFKTTSAVSTSQGIIRKETPSGTRYFWGLNMYDSTPGKVTGEYYSNGSATNVTSLINLNDGQWHHAVLTISGTTLTLYIDGESQGTAQVTGTQNPPTGELNIGADPAYSPFNRDFFFNGQIDEVSVYNYGLSVTQVKQLHNGNSAVSF